MEFYYRKANARVTRSLEDAKTLEIRNVQNYIPIYQNFLKLNEANYNGVGLNSHYELTKILKNDGCEGCDAGCDDCDSHYVIGEVKKRDVSGTVEKSIFIKFSPLLDPIKYLSGKYDITDSKLMALPQYDSTQLTHHPKILDCNNSAYVDGFFTYLSSKVMHAHNLCHGVEYYGSYIAHKQNFEVNITDDIECFQECSFFKSNNEVVYSMDSASRVAYENSLSYLYGDAFDARNTNNPNASMRAHKIKLICGGDNINEGGEDVEIAVDILDDELHTLFEPNNIDNIDNNDNICNDVVGDDAVLAYSMDDDKRGCCDKHAQSSQSSNSSRSSNSTTNFNNTDLDVEVCADDNDDAENAENAEGDEGDEGDDEDDEDDDEDDEGEDDDEGDDDEDDEVYVKIKSFPVNMILMEECDDTLDSLLEDGAISSADEWASILMQIIMTLIAYQKMFWFTHNDLHTNNVMFVETDKPYLYYRYDGKYYRVPTYGKIFKIIDFGRAVYKYKSLTICSDSFHPKGDAATQYNFEPYLNKKKPCLEPNPSFDLCRLACSLFDYFINDISSVSKLVKNDPIIALVDEWVKDDKGRNVLYKASGEERYPNFKLYKMIARTVHGHVPSAQLSNPLFSKYVVLGSDISQKVKKTGLISIDDMPEYYMH